MNIPMIAATVLWAFAIAAWTLYSFISALVETGGDFLLSLIMIPVGFIGGFVSATPFYAVAMALLFAFKKKPD